ncbi:hypothetical protein HKX48_002555 [Thoreauomyces humboldtii]|nr:hypothetical protein HKX48_002555 [Thoreauomyces humboldtii]
MSTMRFCREIDFRQLRALSDFHASETLIDDLNRLRNSVYLQRLSLSNSNVQHIPGDVTRRLQDLTHLNLNDNSITDLGELKYLKSLRALHLVDNRLEDFGALLATVKRLPKLEVLDVRYNPVTTRFYPPLAAPDGQTWEDADEKFARSLQDADFVRRVCYRSSLIMALRGSLQFLDNISTADMDVQSARQQLKRVKSSMKDSLSRGSSTSGERDHGRR